ncbi:cystinosin [Sporothrix brasiliensis 5110]|uniref:Cystinosin n=1 Tax=Sporothrix brasiliensis 5110 TaxID=1398154 RepID=A0A0C2ICB8_9PEZI|nr:cystinosin [Sporothrix brasiliensis 5110]KIH86951.1 cystinosin [Sporothrix brasiliensis 5110]
MDILSAISALCGWIYTISWSLSFYPQPLLNAKRRSTSGTTVDFPLLNCLGFLSYLLSTSAMRYSATVRAEYAARHHGLTPTVAANDVVFAAHALLLSLFVVSQYLLPQIWGWHKNDEEPAEEGLSEGDAATLSDDRPQQNVRRRRLPRGNDKPSHFILGVMAGCMAGVLFVTLLVVQGSGASRGGRATDTDAETTPWQWLDVVYALGYVKVIVTLIKYSPQVLVNWRNRSTQGWSIYTMILDFVGGILSIVQLLLDSYRQHDWSGVTGNPVKLLLGNVSILYDLVFFTQHYVLYAESSRGDGKDLAHEEEAVENSRTQPTERDRLLERQ